MKKRLFAGSMSAACGIGVTIACVLLLISCALVATCINNEYIGINSGSLIVPAVQCLSVFVGTMSASWMTNRSWKACAVVGGSCFVLLICVALLFYDGVDGGVIWGVLACTVGCILSVLLSVKPKKSTIRGRRRGRSR